MPIWSLLWLARFYVARPEDLLVHRLFFPSLFLYSLRALLGHQLRTQGQLNLNTVTLTASCFWQHSWAAFPFHPLPPHPAGVQSHPWATHFENAEPWNNSSLPSSVFLACSLSSEVGGWGGTWHERRRKKYWFRFWQLSPLRITFHTCTWKGFFSKPEQRSQNNKHKQLQKNCHTQ